MKIYTKSGDRGQTSLASGKRVSKAHARIECYGSVDELSSFCGLLYEKSANYKNDLDLGLTVLADIIDQLFTVGSQLSFDTPPSFSIKEISESHVKKLEQSIDEMQVELAPLKNFILPMGHEIIAMAHVCRCVCRRAERQLYVGSDGGLEDLPKEIPEYLNRLSDWFFVYARYSACKLKCEEHTWIGK